MNMFIKLCVGGAIAGLLSAALSTETQLAASVTVQKTPLITAQMTPQKPECQIASSFKGASAADRELSAALKRGLGC